MSAAVIGLPMNSIKEAQQHGKISKGNSKMPGTTYSLAAGASCPVGSRLMHQPGSVCHKCYATRLMAFRPNVARAWKSNLQVTVASIERDPDQWAKAIAYQINRSGSKWHRWFDSGDLQSVAMLSAIVAVCRLTPRVKHWLPTREVNKVSRWRRAGGIVPHNLTIRVSSPMVDDAPLKGVYGSIKTSTVHKDKPAIGFVCEARSRGNQCGDCRACWSRMKNISYPLH